MLTSYYQQVARAHMQIKNIYIYIFRSIKQWNLRVRMDETTAEKKKSNVMRVS